MYKPPSSSRQASLFWDLETMLDPSHWAYIERFCRFIGFNTQDEGSFISFRLGYLKRMAVAFV